LKFTGLTSAEAEVSRRAHGANVIPEPQWMTFGQAFMETFRDPMIRILLVMVALMIAMYFAGHAEIYEPVGTIVTVIIVATVTARTNVASDTEYRALRARTAKDTAKVCRDGGLVVLPVDDIVVGDHVILQGGNKIPADGLLISGDLRVNNTALNGETEECPKLPADTHYRFPEEITGDSFVDRSTLFRGSVVFDGEGVMEVRRVGTGTMMGKMAAEMQTREPDSPLQVKLAKLADQISAFGYVSGLVIIALYMMFFALRAGGLEAYVMGGWSQILVDLIQAVSLAILIIVCAVPEGLPLMISLVLMQNTSRMLARGVLVRRAVGIETAGSLNILFSDKTGTITGGQLEVVEFFTAGGSVLAEIEEHAALYEKLKLAIGMNSAAMYDEQGAVVGGNPTDQAVMRFLGAETYRAMQANDGYRVGQRQTFNSTNKFSQAELPARGTVVYKGAPEALLARAKYALTADGAVARFDAAQLNEKINAYAARAMRVLAFGYSTQSFRKNEINADVVLIGLAAIRDDVRPEAREAIAEVQAAGVQVVMVTGDRRETAVAIARDAGLLRADGDLVLTSSDLALMRDEEVQRILPQLRVIARAADGQVAHRTPLAADEPCRRHDGGWGQRLARAPARRCRLCDGQWHGGGARCGGHRHPRRQLPLDQGRHPLRAHDLQQHPEILSLPARHQHCGGCRERRCALLRHHRAAARHASPLHQPRHGQPRRNHARQRTRARELYAREAAPPRREPHHARHDRADRLHGRVARRPQLLLPDRRAHCRRLRREGGALYGVLPALRHCGAYERI